MLLNEIKDIETDMGTGLPKWVKYQRAKKVSATNELSASTKTKSLVEKVKRLLVLMYPRSHQYTNYRTRSVTVKIDRPNKKDLSNPSLPDNDSYLATEFGVEKRTVGGDTSIIYHIPYSTE